MERERERTYGEEPRRRNPGVNRDRGAVCASASRGIDTNPETEKQQRSAISVSGQSDVIFILLFIDI